MRRLAPAGLLDTLEQEKNFRGRDRREGPLGKRRRKVLQQPAILVERGLRCALLFQLVEVVGGDRAERVPRCGCRVYFCKLALLCRVFAIRQQLPCIIAAAARRRQRDFGERAERKHVLLAAETIAEAPQLLSAHRQQKIKAVAVGELVWLGARLGIADGEQSETHVGTLTVAKSTVPSIVPTAYPHWLEEKLLTVSRHNLLSA